VLVLLLLVFSLFLVWVRYRIGWCLYSKTLDLRSYHFLGLLLSFTLFLEIECFGLIFELNRLLLFAKLLDGLAWFNYFKI
jgi:hypothetical protein